MKKNALKMLFALTLALTVLTSCDTLHHRGSRGNGRGNNDHGKNQNGGGRRS